MTSPRRVGLWSIVILIAVSGCSATSIGLAPVSPKHNTDVKTDSLTLEWEATPESAEEVYYQLVIFDHSGASVYEAEDVKDTRHIIRADLEPGKYEWSVRAVHLRDGDWVPGVWSQREYFHFAVIFFGWGEERYRFTLKQPIHGRPEPSPAAAEPHVYAYRTVGETPLKAYVFSPSTRANDELVNAVLLFHGGGWSAGAPDWVFASAERFAGYGLVAIAIEYRLSNATTTPIDALDDVCHALEWTRVHATELGIADNTACRRAASSSPPQLRWAAAARIPSSTHCFCGLPRSTSAATRGFRACSEAAVTQSITHRSSMSMLPHRRPASCREQMTRLLRLRARDASMIAWSKPEGCAN
jgi:alpha/beta hydrolase fold